MSGPNPKEKPNVLRGLEDGAATFATSFAERLRWLLDLFETRSEAGRIAGVTPEHLPSYLKSGARPRFDTIARLAAVKGVSLDWLATGQGPRLRSEAEPDGFVAVAVQPDAETRYGADDAATVLFSRVWLRGWTATPEGALRFVIHRGDSNMPVIRDGDALLVDLTARALAQDGLYVFPHDGKYLTRFVENFVDGRVALKARNPDYGMQILNREEAEKIQVLGRVCWRSGPI
ncbi:MAG TPA: S24 family peptidase [Rhizomicrobium sp.]|nr:S24 family peptidase [Rhizomicrobium sp.]